MRRDSHAIGVVFTIDNERVAGGLRRGGGVVAVPVGTRGFAAAWQLVTSPRRRTKVTAR